MPAVPLVQCHTLHIYNRDGKCQYYHNWSGAKTERDRNRREEDFKLRFGLLWTMRGLAAAMDPKRQDRSQAFQPARIGEGATFKSFQTSTYKFHYFESPSGLKFVLITDPTAGNLSEALEHVYSQLFVPHVLKNSLYSPGERFLYESFSSALNKYMRSLGLLL